MMPKITKAISCFCLLLLLASCATSPTGQRQLKLFPDSQMVAMGNNAYSEIKTKTPLSKDEKTIAYVTCVTNAVLREVPSDYQWEVNVFEDKAVNAFALPGGKIGVYTGILKVAANQNQLAVVLGHEVAHVIADHGNARVSTAYATQTGLQLAQAMSGAESQTKSQLFSLLGLGAQVGILLPYGRGQESEADILGIDYMARAGFDPRASVVLWQNMAKASAGKAPPELLSTHPSNQRRIDGLNAEMPKALAVYKQARANGKQPNCGK